MIKRLSFIILRILSNTSESIKIIIFFFLVSNFKFKKINIYILKKKIIINKY